MADEKLCKECGKNSAVDDYCDECWDVRFKRDLEEEREKERREITHRSLNAADDDAAFRRAWNRNWNCKRCKAGDIKKFGYDAGDDCQGCWRQEGD